MRTRWRVHRKREVVDYLVGLRDKGKGIRQVISLLAVYGVPANADINRDGIPTVYTWTAAGHAIGCFIEEEERAIYVSEIRPMEPI